MSLHTPKSVLWDYPREFLKIPGVPAGSPSQWRTMLEKSQLPVELSYHPPFHSRNFVWIKFHDNFGTESWADAVTAITNDCDGAVKCETNFLARTTIRANQGSDRSEFHPLLKPNQDHAVARKGLVLGFGSESEEQTLRRGPEQEWCMKWNFQLELVCAPFMVG